jgi:hypothetical protein
MGGPVRVRTPGAGAYADTVELSSAAQRSTDDRRLRPDEPDAPQTSRIELWA